MAINLRRVSSPPPKSLEIQIDRFNKGVLSLLSENTQPKDSAVDATNLIQEQDGRWRVTWGAAYYGSSLPSTISGAGSFVDDDNNNHLWVVAGTTFYRSTDDGQNWTACTGATFTTGHRVRGLQIGGNLYIFNGTNPLARYDGTTTLKSYTSVSPPTSPTATRTGLTAGSYQAYYIVTAVNEIGESLGTAEFSVSGGVNKKREDWDASNYVTVSWTASAGAIGYNLYYSELSGREEFLTFSTTTSFIDVGSVAPNPYIEPPLDNTTTGPIFQDACLSGNRIWATSLPDDPHKVVWSGTGQFQGAFSPFFGGGYVRLEKGGRERPQKVIHYRDGKGSGFATVLTSDPEGAGSIWQIDLQDTTVGDTSFVIPIPVKVVGSVGTIAPLSVVPLKDDVFFFNRRGFFSIGNRPYLLSILSTEELSVNIRPTIQGLTGSALKKVCAIYHDGKVFVSVPSGTSDNNQIMVFDRERRNWNPKAFTFGVSSFFEFSDRDGNNHLLATPTEGSQLIYISRNIRGHFGQPFVASYLSPILHVTPNRVGYARIKKYWVELSSASGQIEVEFLGTTKRGQFSSLSSATIVSLGSGVGWSSGKQWSAGYKWSSGGHPQASSQSTIKRFKKTSKLLNNLQFRVWSNRLDSDWTLNMLLAQGFLVPTNPPTQQKL